MSALDRFSPRQRSKMDRLALATGFDAETLAAEMAAAYFQLIEDAPEALPGRPIFSIVKRAERRKNG